MHAGAPPVTRTAVRALDALLVELLLHVALHIVGCTAHSMRSYALLCGSLCPPAATGADCALPCGAAAGSVRSLHDGEHRTGPEGSEL